MPRKKQRWSIGDLFAIPLTDGEFVLGQVIGHQPETRSSVTVALFDKKLLPEQPSRDVNFRVDDIFSIQITTRDLLDSGHWRIVGSSRVVVPQNAQPSERYRPGHVVAKVIGSGIINEFANAYYGLVPWDDWHQRDYLDGLLISPDKKPEARLKYKDH